MSNNIYNHLEFEQKLSNELSELGIHTQSNFKVPGTDLTLDLYIKAPIRGLIEIKGATSNQTDINKRVEKFREIHSKFNKSIWMFIVFFGPIKKFDSLIKRYQKDLWFQFVVVPDEIDKPHLYCAQEIRKHVVQIAIGLKTNEIKLREKEKYEIQDSLLEVKKQIDVLKNELYKNSEENKYLSKKLQDLQNNNDPSNSDLKEIYTLKHKSSQIRHSMSNADQTMMKLIQQIGHSTRYLPEIDLEIKSLEHQIHDLREESSKTTNIDVSKQKKRLTQKNTIFTRQPIQEGMFKDVLPIFEESLSPDKYKILEKEVKDFEEEYQSDHFTTAALRIGRTLEFVIYTLVQSWGVKTNVASTMRIDKMNKSYSVLREKLINYYSLDNDKQKNDKENVLISINHFSGLLTKVTANLEDDNEVFYTHKPVNIRALLRAVKKQYGRQEETRKAIDNLNKSELIDKTQNKRNEAAHADHSGLKEDFTKDDIKLMSEDLKQILFHLSNINATIIQSYDLE